MPAREFVALVQQLATTVARMRELAHGGRWALLPALDAQCSELFVQLRDTGSLALSAAQQGELQALATRIRSDQQQLNDLVRPQFAELVTRMREAPPAV